MAEKTLRQKFSMKTVLEYILKGWLPDIVGWCTKEGGTKGGGIVNISIIINRNILPMVGGIQSQKITFLVLQLYEWWTLHLFARAPCWLFEASLFISQPVGVSSGVHITKEFFLFLSGTPGSFANFPVVTGTNMGNAQARQRIKARDFDYLAKFTGFVTCEVRQNFSLTTWNSRFFPASWRVLWHVHGQTPRRKDGQVWL